MFPFVDPIEVFQAASRVVEETIVDEVRTKVEVIKAGIEYGSRIAGGAIAPQIPIVADGQPKSEDLGDRILDFAQDAAPYVAGALLGAPAAALMSSDFLADAVSKINPPSTIRVCRTLPDLLIGSDLDPTGILRGGLNLYLGTLLPFSRPPMICRDIPIDEVVDKVKEVIENILPLLGVASALKPAAKSVHLFR